MMDGTLLHTKLQPPFLRPDLLPRPALLNQLDENLPRRLTFVAAPAGFGKSTLALSWLQQKRVAWLSLDEQDDEPQRFLTYFFAAAQTAVPDLATTAVSLLQQQTAPDPLQLLTLFINDLLQQAEPLFLVLDDWHLIQNEQVQEAVKFLIEHAPMQLHLVLLSRRAPTFSISRWQARRQATLLSADALRLDEAETAVFLNDKMKLALSAEAVAVLQARTEGWLASLHLAALMLQPHQPAERVVRIARFSGNSRPVVDYLLDDVFAQLTPEQQGFLLQTAVFPRFSAALCAVLLPNHPNPAGTIQRLLKNNLFLVPIDSDSEWFRYHHLFADFLRAKQAENGGEQRQTLFRRASRWFAEQGLLDEAIEYALRADEIEQAITLLSAEIEGLVVRGHIRQLLHWLSQLPQAALEKQPRLLLYKGWALLFAGRLADVAVHLGWLDKMSDPPNWPLGLFVQVLRGFLATRNGRFLEAIEMTETAVQQLAQQTDPDSTTQIMQGAAAINLADALAFVGRFDDAIPHYQQAVHLNQESGNLLAALGAVAALGQLRTSQGQWQQAAAIYEQGLKMSQVWQASQPPGSKLLAAAPIYAGLGLLHYQWNALEKATPLIEEAALLYALGGATNEAEGVGALLHLRWAEGVTTAVYELLDRLGEMAQQTADTYTRQRIEAALLNWQTRLLTSQQPWRHGKGEISAWLENQTETDDAPAVYATQFIQVSLVRAHLALGQTSEAVPLLQRLVDDAQANGRLGEWAEFKLLAARARQQQGQTSEALAALNAALSILEAEKIVRLVVDEGEPVRQLLLQLPNTAYRGRLLAAFPDHLAESETAVSQLVEPLTKRELEVLTFMASGATNQQIADALVISYATAKKHVSNIIGKLGVPNRSTAVSQARTLGLLP